MATDNGGAIASAAITQLGNYAINAASNKRQFKYQKEAMALQQEQNKALWDYQNAYNTPQAQMERLQDAGLNPRLIYGNSGANTGNAAPIAPTEAPTREATRAEIPDLMMRHLQVRQMDAQYAATKQSIDVMRTRATLNELDSGLKSLKTMQEQARSKNYASLALSEERIAAFTRHKAKQLLYNEQSKGALLDQTYELRQGAIHGQNLDNTFKQNRNNLAELGIYSTDHPAFRVLIQASKRMGIDIGELLAKGAKELKYLLDLAQ